MPVGCQPPLDRIEALPKDQKAVFLELEPDRPKHPDVLAAETGLPSATVLGLLLELELEGFAHQLPGKLFAVGVR